MRNVSSYSCATLLLLAAIGCSGPDSADTSDAHLDSVASKSTAECDIIEQLEGLPDITFVQELPQDPNKPGYVEGTRKFLVKIRQPMDHQNPGGPTFEQRFYLWHRANMAPMVMYSGGYGLKYGNAKSEVTPIVNGNQISIEYRYFEESSPSPKDYRYLTVKQSADDYHHLSTVLKQIYTGKWISTGRSKGGMTSIHYRTFYPDDVAATVPMVAPLQTEMLPERYAEWFRGLGQRFPECHARSTAFFREILKRREMIGKRMAIHPRYTYTRIPIQRVIEFSIKNWTFGTYMSNNPAVDCPMFLEPTVSDDELYQYIDQAGLTYSLSDQGIAEYDFKDWVYQSVAELGNYIVDDEPYRDLLQFRGEHELYEYLPPGSVRPVYDPTAMRLAVHWLKMEGERMFFVYGGSDSWSAAAVQYPGMFDSYKKWVNEGPVTGHGARISLLTPPDQQLAVDRITAWTGSTAASSRSADVASIAGPSADSEEIDPPLPGAVGFKRGQEPLRHHRN